jgi:hypothetical protein
MRSRICVAMSFTTFRLGSTPFIVDATRIISRICFSTSIGTTSVRRAMGGLPDDVVNAVKSTVPFVEVVAAGESCAIETDDADRAAQSAAARLVDEAAGAMESCGKDS